MWSTNTDNETIAQIGQAIREIRKTRRYTQERLAQRSGIGLNTLKRIESGQTTRLDNLIRVLRALRLLDRLERVFEQPKLSPLELVKESKR